MALAIISAEVGAADTTYGAIGQYFSSANMNTNTNATVAAAVALAPSSAAVAADVATLVADGASPTQAHVTALNTAWGTFLTALTAYNTAVSGLETSQVDTSGDVTLGVNRSTVTNMNQLKSALAKIMKIVEGSLGL